MNWQGYAYTSPPPPPPPNTHTLLYLGSAGWDGVGRGGRQIPPNAIPLYTSMPDTHLVFMLCLAEHGHDIYASCPTPCCWGCWMGGGGGGLPPIPTQSSIHDTHLVFMLCLAEHGHDIYASWVGWVWSTTLSHPIPPPPAVVAAGWVPGGGGGGYHPSPPNPQYMPDTHLVFMLCLAEHGHDIYAPPPPVGAAGWDGFGLPLFPTPSHPTPPCLVLTLYSFCALLSMLMISMPPAPPPAVGAAGWEGGFVSCCVSASNLKKI